MSAIALAYRIVRYSGLPFLFRELLFRNKARIVMFHDPVPAAMDRALSYLGKRYTFITLEDLLIGAPIPAKALVVSLDDGHIGNALLLPVFRKHGVRPTIFLCSGLLDSDRHFWFMHRPMPAPVEVLKQLPNAQRVRVMNSTGHTPTTGLGTPQALSAAHIAVLREHVDLQSHGMYHPCLSTCTDTEAWAEIDGSKRDLENRFGLRVNAFAFPNGDYCKRDLELVEKAGYRCAVTVDYGFNGTGTDHFRLKRLSIDDSGNIDAVSVKASGVWTLFRILWGSQKLTRYVERPLVD